MQRAAVYRRQDRVVVFPECQTSAGVWISSEPYVQIGAMDAAVIGQALVDSLQRSVLNCAHPTDWTIAARPRLTAASVKSEAAFQRGASLVSVVKSAGRISVIPTRNGGAVDPGRGFSEHPSAALLLAIDAPADELGRAVIQAFESCA